MLSSNKIALKNHQPLFDVANGRVLHIQTRMWIDAQRHGQPAKYRWHPLFNAAKSGWCPLPEYRAVMLPKR